MTSFSWENIKTIPAKRPLNSVCLIRKTPKLSVCPHCLGEQPKNCLPSFLQAAFGLAGSLRWGIQKRNKQLPVTLWVRATPGPPAQWPAISGRFVSRPNTAAIASAMLLRRPKRERGHSKSRTLRRTLCRHLLLGIQDMGLPARKRLHERFVH